MATLTVLYDYIESRGQWKVYRIVDAEQKDAEISVHPLGYFAQYAEIRTRLEQANPAHTFVLQRRDPCYAGSHGSHDLAACRFGFWSINGAIAYVLCGCTRQRQVSRAQWLAVHPEGGTP